MWLQYIHILVFLFSYVKSDEFSESTWRDMSNKTIKVSDYCRNNKCITKCCPQGQFMAPTPTGIKCTIPLKPVMQKLINSSLDHINVYKWNASNKQPIDTNRTLLSQFTFVQNDVLSNANKTLTFTCEIYVLEDGTVASKNEMSCPQMANLEYCVDFLYMRTKDSKPGVVFTYRAVIQVAVDAKSKHGFIAAGMLVSSVFMTLVLVVYWLLPRLRNIVGMVLMAYLFTLIAAFIMKSVQLIALSNASLTIEKCRHLSPAIFYFIIASFFWLNVMSFDLWWTIRGSRKRRDIHRQGELVKFLWYALYGWGTPALFTLIFVAVDKYQLYRNEDHKPPFASCFAEKTPTAIYVHVPIGIMTAANCVLFLMTAYNVWLVKRALHNVKDANNTKNSENRFVIYIKLSILTGVSWILELVPDTSLVPYILINFYNVFIGVAIFFMFVCKRDVLAMLCKRFHISNRFVDKLQASQYSKSEASKSSSLRKSGRARHNDDEATEMSLYTTNEKV